MHPSVPRSRKNTHVRYAPNALTYLASFAPGVRAAVFGACGGLGGAFATLIANDPRAAQGYAGARRPAFAPIEKLAPFTFDLTDETSIAASAASIGANGPLDLVIVATGLLHDAATQPEKSWTHFNAEAFARAFAINATGPALIAKHMLPLLARDHKAVFAALSARVGSIEDNRLGGWAAYRASKAALHQIVRTCAVELARKNKSAICVALHPGTVATKLSAPFRQAALPEKLLSPACSAERLLGVIDGLTPADSGAAFAWDGRRIPF